MPISYSVYGIESFIETSEKSGGFCLVSSGICNGLTDDLLFLGGQILGLDSTLFQAQDAQHAHHNNDDNSEHGIVEGQILLNRLKATTPAQKAPSTQQML